MLMFRVEQDIVLAAAEDICAVLTWISTYRLPLGPPLAPGWPSPASADLRAVVDATGDGDGFCVRCGVPGRGRGRSWQGLTITSPCAAAGRAGGDLHHGTEEGLAHLAHFAAARRRWSSAWGVVPGSAPVPRQVEQTSSRVISISFSTPKTASSKVRLSACSSGQRRGAARCAVAAANRASQSRTILRKYPKNPLWRNQARRHCPRKPSMP